MINQERQKTPNNQPLLTYMMKTYAFKFLNRLLRSLDRYNSSQMMYKLKNCGAGVHLL